jgi:excisionase family DNA binding protein
MTRKSAPCAGASAVANNGRACSPGTKRFYTIAEVAEITGVSRRTVRRWIARKDLIAHHFGRSVRIADSDLKIFLAQHREC